jgi:D-alanyl-D-alanine carboxypeptidase (penicillin-binding protein 5/6)
MAVLAVVAMTVGLVLQLGGGAPSATVVLSPPRLLAVGGSAPALPWPATGQAALAIPAAGVALSPFPGRPAPVASLTKMMTALVVLRDHPVGPRSPGPKVVMTAADQQDAAADSAGNDTEIPVTAGEVLTERQLLDGLLVHSANDFADALARWDAGSTEAFVAKMNATAAALGMAQTHYADANGISAADTSTPRDQLKLAEAAMAVPAFAAVVAQPAIAEPGAGVLANYVPLVGSYGVVGVKSGFTQAAMGCVVLAVDRLVDGRPVQLLVALTGQQGVDPLQAASASALALADAAAGALRFETLVPAGQVEGSITAPWTDRRPRLTTDRAAAAWVWPGTRWSATLHAARLGAGVAAGQEVATLTLTLAGGGQQVSVPVVSSGEVRSPSRGWRLVHS